MISLHTADEIEGRNISSVKLPNLLFLTANDPASQKIKHFTYVFTANEIPTYLLPENLYYQGM